MSKARRLPKKTRTAKTSARKNGAKPSSGLAPLDLSEQKSIEQKREAQRAAWAEEGLWSREQLIRGVINSLSAQIAVLDTHGTIIAVNEAWERFAYNNHAYSLSAVGVGINYLDVCARAASHDEQAQQVFSGLEKVRKGLSASFESEYPCHSASEERWFVLRATPLAGSRGGLVVAHENVTERKRAEAELAKSEERLRLALHAAKQGLYDLDVTTGIAQVNDEYATMFGYDPGTFEENVARWRERLHPDDRDRVYGTFEAYIRGEIPRYKVEFRQRTNAGDWKWILSIGSIVSRDTGGRPLRMLGTYTDISERKQAEEALRSINEELERRVALRTAQLADANERWDWVLRATQDGVWDWDLLHDSVYFSPRWKEMHGFQETDQPESEEDWLARILPDDRPRVMEKLHAYWQKQEPQFWEEYRIRRKDGTLMWVLDRGIALWDEQGRVVRMVGSETDISWRKESEEALRRSERDFYTLADNVPAFFGYLGSDQRYRFVNRRYEELFGLPSNEIIGMTMLQLIGPEGYAQVQPHLEAALNGETVSFEYCLPVPGANERWLSARYVPDRDAAGAVGGLFVLLTDITSLKQSEVVLRAHEARLSHLSAMLLQAQEDERRRIARELHDDVTQRLAAVAMELGALSHCQAPAEEQSSKNLGGLREKVERLTDDLQQLAHELHPSILDHVGLEAAIREHADEFAARTGLSVEVMVDDVPRSIPAGHATCLYRVLQESLQNVRKHAGATNVLVRLLRTGHGVGLCVHDDGRGFPPREAGKGVGGLGLTSMAERLGLVNGEFRIRSKPGDGTEVHAWVPIPNEKESEIK